jgi:two-component system cell cycle sensor histidine kinase PleC
MFGYLRIFSLLSLLLVSGVSVMGGAFLNERAVGNLTQLIEKSNANLAHGYVNAVWKRYRDLIVPLLADPSTMKDNAVVGEFARETVRYFQNMPLTRVNIYSPYGQLLISDNVSLTKKLANNPSSPDVSFVVKHYKGFSRASQVLTDVTLLNQEHIKLVQTITPFTDSVEGVGNAPPDGALEILFDITEQYDELRMFQYISSGALVGVYLIFLIMLMLSSKKAESIISKQHEANMELTEAAAAAEAENREKSQFLANISHELRTPLNAIIGFSDIIKKEMMPQIEDKKYHDYIGDIHSSGVHLLSLINDILDYSKAEAGKLALEVSEVNASKLVQNSMRLVSPRAESANVKLLEQLPKEAIIMITDGKKFKQVLLNLLSNAVKFTPAGGQVLVTAWQNIADDTFSFEVEDTGIGIAPKDISRAMSPFGQVDNTLKRKYEGTGLGLPLTKKFVELMGGKFKIESELNKGTKITFTMPREIKEREGITVKQAS